MVRCLVQEVRHQSTGKHKLAQGGAVEVGSCEEYGGMLKWGVGGGGVERKYVEGGGGPSACSVLSGKNR